MSGLRLLVVMLALFTAIPATAKKKVRRKQPKRHRVVIPSNHARALRKWRSGSILKKHAQFHAADLRGEYEKRRDHEVESHLSRLAMLDRVRVVAAAARNLALVSRAEAVRRAEIDRFNATLRSLYRDHSERLRWGSL